MCLLASMSNPPLFFAEWWVSPSALWNETLFVSKQPLSLVEDSHWHLSTGDRGGGVLFWEELGDPPLALNVGVWETCLLSVGLCKVV